MKKLLILVLTLLVILTLVACSGNLSKPQNGTYRSESTILAQTWTFTGSDKVTLSAAGGLISTQGTYRISGDRMTITSSLLGIENTTSYTITEITTRSFFIDGTKFVKQ